MTRACRIDTHAHMVPDFYGDWLKEKNVFSGGLPIPDWSVDAALAFMERNEIEASVLSVSTPGVEVAARAEARKMARRLNEFAARVVADHPGRFGFFATLPLVEMDDALDELTHVCDALGADGVVLGANVAGTYLGDPRFDVLMQELNHRGAVALIHPGELPGAPVPGFPPFVADFLLDTVRAAVNLCSTGVTTRYENIKFILSHGGGFLPFAAFRLAVQASPNRNAKEGMRLLRRFFLDTAIAASKYSLPSLFAFADPNRLLYGSDFPFAPVEVSSFYTRQLDDWSSVDHSAVNQGNAERLFPRLRR